ncbi:MAG: hypothetical protein LBL79_12485 [Prevotella sp.]|jgi:hypothetical protein|nr:hypothetical protein [Prevotella sp.]
MEKRNDTDFINSFRKLPPKRRIIIYVICIFTLILIPVLLFSGVFDEDTGHQRTEKDYTTQKWVVEEVMERQILEHGRVINRYNFIKPEGEDFNLSLPVIVNGVNEFTDEISSGDNIEAKVYTPELEEMQSGNIFKKLKRFMKQDNREVEVFKLTVNGELLFEKKIDRSDVNFRKGGDFYASRIMYVLVVLCLVFGVIGWVRTKLKAGKAQGNNKK